MNVTIINNSAEDGGGIYCDSLSLPRLENVAIINNSAERYGGGIYCKYSFPMLLNVTMTGNSAAFGGGFHIQGWFEGKSAATLKTNGV